MLIAKNNSDYQQSSVQLFVLVSKQDIFFVLLRQMKMFKYLSPEELILENFIWD